MEFASLEVKRRMAAQLPEEEKAKLADFVIDNSGNRDVAEQRAGEIWVELTAAATGR
jgi:dephospho-CoA kinase